MPKLDRQSVYNLARQAGFVGTGLDMAVAIATAESGLDTSITHYNPSSASTDRGLWQINDRYHPEVSDQCAFNATCCASAAFRISSGGNNWQPWSTYNNGAYRQYLTTSGGGGSIVPVPGPVGVDAFRQALVPNGKLISVWGDPRPAPIFYHQGEDLQAPSGSNIHAPESGLMQRNYNDSLGGNAFILALDSGIWVYGAHMLSPSPIKQGTRVDAGTVIGQVGNTGDASTTVSHLHYQVGPGGNWQDPRAVLSSWTPGSWTGGGAGGGTGVRATSLELFDGPGYTGRSTTISDDDHYVAVGTLFGRAGDIRSIKPTPSNGSYTLYRDINYAGPFVVVTGNVPETKSVIQWSDPDKFISSIRLGDYSGGAGTGSGGGSGTQFVLWNRANAGWLAVGEGIHKTITDVPGFTGVALAIDQAEQFPGVISFPCTPDVTQLKTCAPETVRGVIATVIGNSLAFSVRGIITAVGMILMAGLLINAAKGPVMDAGRIATMVA